MLKVYRSKVDWWLWGLIVGLVVMLLVVSVLSVPSRLWAVMLPSILPTLLVADMLCNTRYSIDTDRKVLHVKSGVLFVSKYDINKITTIEETRTWQSSPALSLDRVEVSLGKRASVIISPQNKDMFIQDLLSLNPAIEKLPRNK